MEEKTFRVLDIHSFIVPATPDVPSGYVAVSEIEALKDFLDLASSKPNWQAPILQSGEFDKDRSVIAFYTDYICDDLEVEKTYTDIDQHEDYLRLYFACLPNGTPKEDTHQRIVLVVTNKIAPYITDIYIAYGDVDADQDLYVRIPYLVMPTVRARPKFNFSLGHLPTGPKP